MGDSRKFFGDEIINLKELMETKRKGFIKLEYYGIKRVTDNQVTEYGIEVIKKEYINKQFIQESSNVNNIASDEIKMENIISILKRNKVTPVGLDDIITDLTK